MAVKIELNNITKKYGDFVAVDGIDLTIEPSEFVCLLGPSGCGKTTTLRMIAGLETPTSGTICFNGLEVENTKVYKRNVSMVFQNYALFPHKTVEENIAFGLRMRKYPKDQIKERIAEAIRLVSVEGLEKRYPKQLSGGQQQRVALARAIVYEPDVLLLDEPLSALDKKLRDQMRFELRRIQQTVGITTVFVTHDQEEAMSLSDRIVVMDNACIVQTGTADEIYRHPSCKYVADFLGTSNFFEGKIRHIDGRVGVCLAQGEVAFVSGEYEEGREVTVSIRPQVISFTRNEPTDNEIEAEFISMSYLGMSLRYLLQYGEKQIFVESLNSEVEWRLDMTPGERVKLYFSPSNASVLTV